MDQPDILSMLQAADRSLYQCVLFAPEDKREALAALHLYALELARVPQLVREPMAGEIRLQWWQEVIDGQREGEAAANPIAKALMDALQAHDLPRTALANMAAGRVFELYNDPMPDIAALEGYCGEIFALPYQMSVMIIAAEQADHSADISGHAGMVTGIAAIIKRLKAERTLQKCSVPNAILAAAGFDLEAYYEADDAALKPVYQALQALGREHRAKFHAALKAVDHMPIAAYLPLVMPQMILAAPDKERSQFRKTIAITKTAIMGF